MMNRIILPLLLLAALALVPTFAQPPTRFLQGTSAPSSGTCDSAAEVGALYIQTGDPASVPTRISACVQTGTSTYGWNPIGFKTGTALPATCTVGDVFFDTDATAGSNWYGCTASDTWNLLGGGGSGSPGGSDTQVQFNSSGTFAGDAGMTYNSGTDTLTVLGGVETGNGSTAGVVTLRELDANGSNFRAIAVSDSLSSDVTVKLFEGTLPSNNDCVKATVSGSTVTLEGAGAACGSGSGGVGAAPYSTTSISASPMSIPASTHGQGVHAFGLCWDSASNPQIMLSCNWSRNPANGDLTLTYSSAPGAVQIYGATGGFADPMTDAGDMIYRNGSNATSRLAKGTQYQVLLGGSSAPGWGAVSLDQASAVSGILPNSNTTAASANTASAIVARDGSGNFSAGTITAALTGNASTATALAANPADCSAGQYATAIAANGDLTCAQVAYSQISSTPTLYNQTVEDEGTPVTQRGTLNFTGAGVSVADSGGKTTITIAGGGSSAFSDLTGGTNTGAAMLVGTGASLGTTGSGTISASTAAALGANPADCASDRYATAIAANGDLTCAQVSLSAGVTGTLPNSNTTATSANTASAIVARDASGNFTAGTITAALTGNSSTATALAANPTDCASDRYATTIAANGDLTCSQVSLSAGVTGTLPAANGGTGSTTLTFPGGTETVVGRASTDTLTNKTLDAESTGNSITLPFTMYLTAAGCNNATAATAFDLPTSSAPSAVCLGTTTTTGYLSYADGSTTAATTHWSLPSDWSGALDITLHYSGSSSSTNNIRWQVSTSCVADGESLTAGSYNTASASNSAGPTTTPQRKSVTFSSVSMTNCAAGETVFFRFERVGGDGGDTYTGSAYLLAAEIRYRRTM